MAEISGRYKRAFLRVAYDAAPDGAQTFKEYLFAVLKGKITDTATGRQVTGTSGSGQSVSFYIPPSATPTDLITPTTLAKFVEEAMTCYEKAVAGGVTDEADILALLLDCCDPDAETGPDYTRLRVGSGVAWT